MLCADLFLIPLCVRFKLRQYISSLNFISIMLLFTIQFCNLDLSPTNEPVEENWKLFNPISAWDEIG